MEDNDLMSEKHQKTCKYLNYNENLIIISSTVAGCVSISGFASINLCNYCMK